MKIKEVTAITGLTDRAIRLYIFNGLVAPIDNKTHTGRSNLNFSESDVELLNKIAVLRKAGFSLAQIKSIETDSGRAQVAVNELLDTKKKEQEINAKVIEALSPLCENNKLNIDVISECLEGSMSGEKLPETDLKLTVGERVERIVFISTSILIFLFTLYLLAASLMKEFSLYRYPHFEKQPLSTIIVNVIFLSIPMVCAIFVITDYIKHPFQYNNRVNRAVKSAILLLIELFATIVWIIIFTFTTNSIFYSSTDDPANYLKLDEYPETYSQVIYELFPPFIPYDEEARNYESESTKGSYKPTTEYFYSYNSSLGSKIAHEYSKFEIYAQWQLSDDKFKAEVTRVKNMKDFKKDVIGGFGWRIIYFDDINTEFAHPNAYSRMFSYNDTTNMVRYMIKSYDDSVYR